MKFVRWIKWFFWECRRCDHVSDQGTLINMGMGKVWHCKKCGKCLEIV